MFVGLLVALEISLASYMLQEWFLYRGKSPVTTSSLIELLQR